MPGMRCFSTVAAPEVSDRKSSKSFGSMPSGLHSANCSPSACQYTISGRLTASLSSAPPPTGPACCTRRHNWSRIGRARAASSGAAPIKPSSLPVRAGITEPLTGHST